MAIYPVKIKSNKDLVSLIAKVGADPRSVAYFVPKREVFAFWIPDVDFRAAAYLKQEMLARGGDAVVHRNVIDAQSKYSNVLLIGTEGQYKALFPKLEAMSCWGIEKIRKELAVSFKKYFASSWKLPLPRGRFLNLKQGETKIMGILNATPDSFYAGNRLESIADLLKQAEHMLETGADILDLGAESTRPGADPISEEEEKERLLPSLQSLRKEFPEAIISVDTYKGEIATIAAENGADIINDISGFSLDDKMLEAVAQTTLPYVLSHIQGAPKNMQTNPYYNDVIGESLDYFKEKLQRLQDAGVSAERIIIDPGIGFGKRLEDNLRILKSIQSFRSLGHPLLIGHSRKGFIKTILAKEDLQSRLYGTLAVSAHCAQEGVELVRVHDVEATHDVIKMVEAVREAEM
ncbi:MAG: dihydropteroate synthase [Aminobacterium sp.]|uniref:dihydropteroate synthase n=1 Tax=Aminobacterium sp. TaxID=1872491 RepID=UPI002A2EA87B|nr:dihydropteroate synthase [Aminobacterium sp.]MDD2206198.1 dihydropteroate synthase [Aminobacterium sp.]MDD3707636.1 dihydropteroate synthase [Aminobacterium sp.]MDD4227958.1 dihydropteroate synthase [Aminobacterium sp.]MDD4551195.1 dihydropteroate synthase [Aminobacterium sp.]MEA4876457.1 dihydropteroate synthase [Aminobacterium sp.]